MYETGSEATLSCKVVTSQVRVFQKQNKSALEDEVYHIFLKVVVTPGAGVKTLKPIWSKSQKNQTPRSSDFSHEPKFFSLK